MKPPLAVLAAAFVLVVNGPAHSADSAPSPAQADVVVYGGTPSGIMAAVAAARHGHSVALIDLKAHVGGVVSGGLVSTDTGDRKTIGGLSDEFFQRILKYYSDTYGPDATQKKACHEGLVFEPHVAELIYEQMIHEQPAIQIWRQHRFVSATLDGGHIASITMEDVSHHEQRTFTGAIFIDASYEGDLMAGAHVPYRVGRESRAEFGEYLAGLQSGPKALRGLGDHHTMSYNYRVSVTLDTANRVLFPKPEHYDPEPFRKTDGVRILRGAATGFGSFFTTVEKAGPNGKFDANWGDFVGNSEGYAEGDWETRARIEAKERDYFLSRLYYLQNDPELPEAFRNEARTWGLPKDEFADHDHFPFQFYIREARRMLGRYIYSENDITQNRSKPDGVCASSYGVDCHYVYTVLQDGKPVVDHTPHVATLPSDIPYASLTPYEPDNLLVPVCLSATHVAYCSLRMEPVFMMLGHAAGDAAHLAISNKTSVQNVDTRKLRDLIREEHGYPDAGYQPDVHIRFTPERPMPGEMVRFSLQSGNLKSPLKQTWWDFEGNGAVGSQEMTHPVEHAFTQEKIYTVALLVEDQDGRKREVTVAVPVGRAWNRDLTMDDFEADLFGRWDGAYPIIIQPDHRRTPDIFFGPGMHRDVERNGKKAPARARFQPAFPTAGRYQVCLAFRANRNQATNVPIVIHHAKGIARLTVDERTEQTPFNFVPIGEFTFHAGATGYVEITNGNTDGAVVIDGVRWLWLSAE